MRTAVDPLIKTKPVNRIWMMLRLILIKLVRGSTWMSVDPRMRNTDVEIKATMVSIIFNSLFRKIAQNESTVNLDFKLSNIHPSDGQFRFFA